MFERVPIKLEKLKYQIIKEQMKIKIIFQLVVISPTFYCLSRIKGFRTIVLFLYKRTQKYKYNYTIYIQVYILIMPGFFCAHVIVFKFESNFFFYLPKK